MSDHPISQLPERGKEPVSRRVLRAMTDMLLRSLRAAPFTWGRVSLTSSSVTRASYISALRAADDGVFGPLARFVRG